MLHELLLALSGDSGGIFVQKRKEGLQVAADLPFIHESEAILLNRICRLGSYYCGFQAFIKTHSELISSIVRLTNGDKDDPGPHGLYIQAFCTGLDEVLEGYRQELVALEHEVLKDPHLPLSHVEHRLEKFTFPHVQWQQVLKVSVEPWINKTQDKIIPCDSSPEDSVLRFRTLETDAFLLGIQKFLFTQLRENQYQVLFPALAAVIDHIKSKKASGCQLLDILFQSCICGIPDVKDALERILFVCHGVLYQQLSAWLLHGLLIDSQGEFLIIEVAPKDMDTIKSMESVTESVTDLGIPGVTGKQLAEIMEGEDKQHIPIHRQFRINADMLPSYIPTRVADKILFVGESVKLFDEEKSGKSAAVTDSIIHDNEETFLRSLYDLKQQPRFNLTAFENEIDKIRACVAEHLWKLVVEEANLLKHLRIVKDFFLLGRGELFSVFVEKTQSLLKVPPSANTSHDANAAFQQVLNKFLPDDDESGSLFTLSVDMSSYQAKRKSAQEQGVISGWDCLKFDYNVQWPLHILFQQNILEKYNCMFRYLLTVKRTQLDLQRVWAIHMRTKHQSSHVCQLTRVWLLRMHMAFLVDNLQYYLQVDVLEAHYTQLLERINSTRDFESIRLAHDHFITTLMAHSFLLMKPVAHCLDEILSLCQAYCTLLLQVSDKISEREEAQVENIAKNYERQSSLLFKILSSVRSHQASPHLAQLLLRIDFNKHFSSSAAPSWGGEGSTSGVPPV